MIGIIIVTYNSARYLPRLLDSIYRQTEQGFKVLIVDNNSEDICWPDYDRKINVIHLEENRGYAAACNVGIDYFMPDPEISSLLILNHDVHLDRECFAQLLVTQKNTQAGLVQPKILLFDEKHINTLGNSLHYLGFSFCADFNRDDYIVDRDHPIQVASGAAVLLSREFAKNIRFDESFFLYCEDTDLSWQALRANYSVYLSADAVAYHDYAYRLRGKKYFYLERNRLLMLYKNYHALTLWKLLPVALFTELAVLWHCLREGAIHWKLLAYFAALGRLPQMKRVKRAQHTLYPITDREIIKQMSPEIHFGPIDSWAVRSVLNPVLRWYYRMIR